MKRTILFLFFLGFFLSLTSAATIEMNSEFDQGSLLLAKISGNFIDYPSIENILLFEKDTLNRVPVQATLLKLENDYYFSTNLPQESKNYSLFIKKIKYHNGTEISEEDLRKDFTINPSLADFYVTSGVIKTSESFSINFQNLKNERKDISTKFLEIERIVSLSAGESKSITFEIENISISGINYLSLETEDTKYQIPVFILQKEPKREEPLKKSFEFIPLSINATFSTNSSGVRIIYLNNTGEFILENISFRVSHSLKEIVSLSIKNLSELEKSSMVRIEMNFLNQTEEGYFEGQISAKEGDDYSYLPINVEFRKDYVPSEDEKIDPLDGTGYYTPPQPTQKDIEGGSSLGKTIGWIIVILVVLVAGWFFLKKYKVAKGKSPKF
jgi:hypothetical protein